jgi:Tol biopolymer transport system component
MTSFFVPRAVSGYLVALSLVGCVERGLPEPREEPPPEPELVADFIQEAVWSADGRRLLASWYRQDGYVLYGLLPPDTSGAVPAPSRGIPLTDGVWASWAPDGLWVAFGTQRDGNGEVYRARPDGTGPENLTRHPAADGEPDYAPDGRRVAFTSDRESDGPRIWIMDAEGGNPRPLTDQLPESAQYGPDWSPDGRHVAFYATADDGSDTVYVAEIAGGSVRPVGTGAFPAWSADGLGLYYDRGDIIFWRPTEGGEARLVVADGFAGRPSPDGRWLAFVRGSWPNSVLFVLDLETGTETPITR